MLQYEDKVYYYPGSDFRNLISALKDASIDVGLCHGCFDVFHFGHAIHIAESKASTGFLIVSLTTDKHVNKGLGRPIFTEENRAMVLQSMRAVDAVVVNKERTAEGIINFVKPNLLFKGADYKGLHHEGLRREQEMVERNGGRLIYTEGDRYSSTKVLEEIKGDSI